MIAELDTRYVYGPLPEVVCLFQLMIKNVINMQTVLLCDGVTAARYLFIFYLKNPFQFQDEFWHTFCNAWVASFALLSQFVFVYSPGHQPLNFFLCVGKNPRTSGTDLIVKKNFCFNIILLLSIILQVSVAIKFVIHRLKIDSVSNYTNIGNFKKENIFDILICATFLVISIIYGYLMLSINSIHPSLINVFPNYFFVYGLHFGFPLFCCSVFSLLFYAKNKHMRSTLWEEIKDIFIKQAWLH